MDSRATVVSIDGVGAYDLISRNAMLEGLLRMEQGDQILPFVRCFYGSPSTYFFFFREPQEWKSVTAHAHLPHKKNPSPRQVQLNLSSLITSCIDGTFPAHGTGRRSTSDSENALTMLHASRELHQRNHAALALSWRIMGTVSSGQVVSFLRLAVCRATPLWSAALGLANPSCLWPAGLPATR